jgi:Concanavalin A-like lectin/glucanases superfamily
MTIWQILHELAFAVLYNQSVRARNPSFVRTTAAAAALSCMFFLLVIPRISHADITSGLVGYWTFDGTDISDEVNDRSGQDNNGYFFGGATSTAKVQGKLGQALSFDGANTYVDVGNPASLSITGSITLSAWVMLHNTNPDDAVIISKRGSSGSLGYKLAETLDQGPNQAQLTLSQDGTADTTSYGATTLKTNTWYHIVGVYDTSVPSVHIYVNGVLDDGNMGPAPSSIHNTTATAEIGRDQGGGATNIDGIIDDVRIYNRALSAHEVQQLYQYGQALHKPPNNLGLIGYWPMNEGSGLKAGDFSGFGHIGIFNNSPIWTSGKLGGALSFNGNTPDALVISNSSGVADNLANMSIALWFKTTEPGMGALISKIFDDTNVPGWMLLMGELSNPGRISFQTQQDASTWHLAQTNAAYNDGKWHHLVATLSGGVEGTITIYVDGAAVSTTANDSGTVTTDSNAQNIVIGDSVSHTDIGITSAIDDVRIYNRALGAVDVANLYDQGTAGATQVNASSAALDEHTSLGPSGGLVGHWTFDGADTQSSIADVSGQGNNGYMIGAATSSEKIAGVLGQALNFDTTNYVQISNGTPYDFTNGTFSVSAWFKPSSNIGSVQRIVDHAGGCGNGWTLEYDDGFASTKGLSLQLNNADFPGSNINVITLGKWQQVGFTDNAGTVTFYVNGVAQGSTSGTQLPLAANDNLVLGGASCRTNRNISAGIDDVRVYNRALSAAEMGHLYKLGIVTISP